jgi:ribosome maturation protein Sdo1
MKEITSYLNELKIHIDQVDNWARQATNIIYFIEEKLMDIEDKNISCKKTTIDDSMDFLKLIGYSLKDTATRNFK